MPRGHACSSGELALLWLVPPRRLGGSGRGGGELDLDPVDLSVEMVRGLVGVADR